MAVGSSSLLLGNSAWNASAFLVSAGLTLVILPFVLLRLGAIARLVTACVAPALAFNNSLALSTTRELAYRLRSIVVRLFSVYGPHLRKQLLWDLCSRFHRGERTLVLGGTGDEYAIGQMCVMSRGC